MAFILPAAVMFRIQQTPIHPADQEEVEVLPAQGLPEAQAPPPTHQVRAAIPTIHRIRGAAQVQAAATRTAAIPMARYNPD